MTVNEDIPGTPVTVNEETLAAARRRAFAVFDGAGDRPLVDLASALLERQKRTWPALAAGYQALGEARLREIRGDGWGVNLQCNPQRIVSSGAAVDPKTVRRRPCFLCPGHLPPEQQAILYREEYLVLCNPMPIFPGHLTIAHHRHRPQSLAENLPALLRLADDFGPRMTLFYNGPRAGASAPDHLHFQAAPAGLMPVERDILDPRKRSGAKRQDGVVICRTAGLARGMLIIEGNGETELSAAVERLIGLIGRRTASEGEPLLNLLCTRTGPGWRLLFVPRQKHRPDAYFRQGEERLLISPGAVDMGGVVIAAREADFQALTAERLLGIFREVAFDDEAVAALLDAL